MNCVAPEENRLRRSCDAYHPLWTLESCKEVLMALVGANQAEVTET